ncbi:hypothetical protein Droror1_Dr00021672 [Drosera rotundifolia]
MKTSHYFNIFYICNYRRRRIDREFIETLHKRMRAPTFFYHQHLIMIILHLIVVIKNGMTRITFRSDSVDVLYTHKIPVAFDVVDYPFTLLRFIVLPLPFHLTIAGGGGYFTLLLFFLLEKGFISKFSLLSGHG